MCDGPEHIPITDEAAFKCLRAITREVSTSDDMEKNWKDSTKVTDDHVSALKKAVGANAMRFIKGNGGDGTPFRLTFLTDKKAYAGCQVPGETVIIYYTGAMAHHFTTWRWA